MSEQDQDLPIQFANSAQAALDAGKSAGQQLREAREAQGMHVAALAVALKVPVKKLEALEADRLEDLPDAVFVRALASSVCRALKIDSAPILEKLPQLNQRLASQESSGVNVAFRSRADGPTPSVFANLSKPVIGIVMVLLLGAIILMMLPDFSAKMNKANNTESNTANSSALGNASGAATAQTGVTMGNPVNLDALPNSTTTVVTSTSAHAAVTGSQATLSLSPSSSTPSVPSPTLTISAQSSSTATPTVAIPEGSLVVFTASGETWVEVRDVNGKVNMRRLLKAGDKVGATGRTPLSVTIGRSDQVQVTVRDQAFDLKAVSSKDLVARFKVK